MIQGFPGCQCKRAEVCLISRMSLHVMRAWTGHITSQNLSFLLSKMKSGMVLIMSNSSSKISLSIQTHCPLWSWHHCLALFMLTQEPLLGLLDPVFPCASSACLSHPKLILDMALRVTSKNISPTEARTSPIDHCCIIQCPEYVGASWLFVMVNFFMTPSLGYGEQLFSQTPS